MRLILLLFLLIVTECASNSRLKKVESSGTPETTKTTTASVVPPDWVLVPMFSSDLLVESNVSSFHYKQYSVHLAVSTESLSMVLADGLQRTSKMSRHCHVSVNGGPFHSDGTPVGWIIVNSTNQTPPNTNPFGIGFGTLKHARQWIFGQVSNATSPRNLNQHTLVIADVESFVSGFNWLVYQQQVNLYPPGNPTGAERAPRTAVGVDAMGRLLLLVVDGCEKCWKARNRGLTLAELAELLLDVGAHYAINLDGGSSTTFCQDGVVQNRPTCLDIPILCERRVSNALCLSSEHHSSHRKKTS